MDGMNPFSTDSWMQQQYPNNFAMDATGSSQGTTGQPLYGDSSQGTTGQQASSKPIRRRSRASRKTPTTVLNASPNEFRALVQRFTGYDSKESVVSASVVSLPKGPVNIDFACNDVHEITYPVRLPQQVEQSQPVGGLNDFHVGFGMDDNTSAVYEAIQDSNSLMETRRDGGHGYNL